MRKGTAPSVSFIALYNAGDSAHEMIKAASVFLFLLLHAVYVRTIILSCFLLVFFLSTLEREL